MAPQYHDQPTVRLGPSFKEARGAVVLVHGRGSSAEEIAGLAGRLTAAGIAFVAPSADRGSWYPHRFLAPFEHNEPWLSSGLQVIGQLIDEIEAAGISGERVGMVGFSQGACLALEGLARHPRRLGFVAGLSGALMGPLGSEHPGESLEGTPVLLGCAANDFHIPLDHVEETARAFEARGAKVTKIIKPGEAHAVFPEEIDWLNDRLAAW